MKNLGHTCNPEADKYCAEGADPNRHDLAFPVDWIGQHSSHTGGCTCPIGELVEAMLVAAEIVPCTCDQAPHSEDCASGMMIDAYDRLVLLSVNNQGVTRLKI